MSEKIEYVKSSKTVTDLLDLLIARGLIVEDRAKAEKFLSNVNYYRLSGYWFNYQNKVLHLQSYPNGVSEEQRDDIDNRFVRRVTFDNIVDIYRFDTKLRSLCLDALEKIEISCGSLLCEHMCNKYGGYWFEDSTNVKDIIIKKDKKDANGKFVFENGKKIKEDIKIWSSDILKERFNDLIQDNKTTPCIKHFNDKYNNDYPPYWIISTLITFGLLSKIYASLKVEDKMEIALKLNIPPSFLEDVLKSLSYIRNICAHYGRLWNRYMVIPPPDIKFNVKGNNVYKIDFGESHKFFPVFYVISYLLKKIASDSKWCNLVVKLINRYKDKTSNVLGKSSLISFENMGFPVGWDEYPLFLDMLEDE